MRDPLYSLLSRVLPSVDSAVGDGGGAGGGGGAGAGAAGITAEAHAKVLADFQAATTELAAIKGKGASAELERLQAEHAAALETAATESKKHETRAGKLEAAVRKQAALSHLKGLKSGDKYFALIESKVALDDAGNLTAEAKTALDAWKTESPELFGEDGPAPHTPGAAGGSRGTGTFSEADQALLARHGIKPGANHDNPAYQRMATAIAAGRNN